MVRPEGFEPPTPGLGILCSILLSYGRGAGRGALPGRGAKSCDKAISRPRGPGLAHATAWFLITVTFVPNNEAQPIPYRKQRSCGASELLQKDTVDAVFGCWTSLAQVLPAGVFDKLNGLLFYPVQYEGEESGGVLLGNDYVYPPTTNKILRAFWHSKSVADADIMETYTPFGHWVMSFSVATRPRIKASCGSRFDPWRAPCRPCSTTHRCNKPPDTPPKTTATSIDG